MLAHSIVKIITNVLCIFRYFEKQFEMVEQLQLPLFLHSRAAGHDFAAIIKRHRDKIKGGVVSYK
jgi:Tat protein secretion system quality control protein TatD with DNase activity